MIDVFIPSYHRAQNIKTAKFLIKNGYDTNKIHIIIDDEADDSLEYKEQAIKFLICNNQGKGMITYIDLANQEGQQVNLEICFMIMLKSYLLIFI